MWMEKSKQWKAKDWNGDEKFHDVFEVVTRCTNAESYEDVIEHLEKEAPNILKWCKQYLKEDAFEMQAKREPEPKKKNSYTPSKKFSTQALQWWKGEGISESTLKKFEVKQLNSFSFGDNRFDLAVGREFAFIYSVNDYVKLYQPVGRKKRIKFSYLKSEGNWSEYVFGYDQLPKKGDCVVIAGGEKDVMSWSELGIPAITGMSEVAQISPELIEELKGRFKNIVVVLDNDSTGLGCSKKLANKFDLSRLVLSDSREVKDVTDYRKVHRNADSKLHRLIEKVINKQARDKIYDQPYPLSWNTFVKPKQPIVSINGTHIASNGNVLTLVARPGLGKSSIVEMLASSFIDPEIDLCGIRVTCNKPILLVDTERTREDVSKTFARICARLGVVKPEDPKRMMLWSLAHITSFKKKRKYIEDELMKGDYGLVVIDGATDFVTDSNDAKESNAFTDWLRVTAQIYDLPILVTIHSNPTDDKPRGHLGSDLCRRSETVMGIKVDDSTGERIHCLTTKVPHGKLRNDNKQLEMFFKWNDEKKMFVESEEGFVTVKKNKRNALSDVELTEKAHDAFEDDKALSHGEIKVRLAEVLNVSEDTARKNYLKKLMDLGIVIKDGKKYSLKSK
jgi:hypothetical protein